MASTSPTEHGLRWLLTPGALALVWAPLGVVVALHYGTPPDWHWVHDLARRLYYVPIVLAGSRAGLRGGLLTAVVATLLYLPHAFAHGMLSEHAFHDPGSVSEKVLEIIFYFVLGAASGAIADRASAEKAHLEQVTEDLQRTLHDLEGREAELRRAARLESIGELTAGLAHEIRNPLHAMRGTAEILLDAVPPDAPEAAMGHRHLAEIDRLSTFLTRFLSFAKGEPPSRASVDLHEVCTDVAELVDAQAQRQGTTLQVDPGSAIALADREQLVQVVLGIVVNGLQAVGSGGTVTLSAHAEAEGAVLTLTNSGPPIDEAVLPRLFDPFVTSRDEGTGLGLSVAWRIIDAHGGTLEAKNVEEGVRFTVRLAGGD